MDATRAVGCDLPCWSMGHVFKKLFYNDASVLTAEFNSLRPHRPWKWSNINDEIEAENGTLCLAWHVKNCTWSTVLWSCRALNRSWIGKRTSTGHCQACWSEQSRRYNKTCLLMDHVLLWSTSGATVKFAPSWRRNSLIQIESKRCYGCFYISLLISILAARTVSVYVYCILLFVCNVS